MLDLAITGGTLVDGTGGPARRADVGVRDGRVVALAEPGGLDERASRTIDAEGLTVMPGVVDLHTHYDAQLHWDPTCSPSVFHGVTTVVSGNCGLTLAPAAPADQSFLLGLLSRVEAIPLAAIEAGVDFAWSTFPELLDAMAATGYGVNVALMTGHAALRRAVMGEAASESAADDTQVKAMAMLLDEALAAGGFGLSTAAVPTQVDLEGRPSPPTFAGRAELLALAEVCGRHAGTSLEFIPASYLRGFSPDDVALMADMSAAADRPLNWNLVLVNREDPDLHRRQLAATEAARARGGRVVPLAMPQNGQLQQDFQIGYVFRALPGWRDVFDLPVAERCHALADLAVRDRLRQRLEAETAGLAVTLRRVWGRFVVNEVAHSDLRPLLDRSIASIAAERGVSDFDAILDVAVAGGLEVGFVRQAYDSNDDWIREARAEVLRDRRVVFGASDAGAHLDMMVGGDYPTRAIAELVREQGLFTIEELVHRLCAVPAALYGLRDRGVVAAGGAADLVVLDPDTAAATRMHTVRDLPAGAARLTSEAIGVERVLIAGREVVRAGELTGDLPGRVLRSGRDSETVTAR
ncbi:MAG: N-acyl-D-aspartate/D-glutamate deacylase [Acidimicrobiales bacterium]|jgi:N-acyl-D-aspartate/D-glutamate deacylase|nr:N-acyl-D-aspartate/D-glutamate deacylase [Acidimicrobiales bacterium]